MDVTKKKRKTKIGMENIPHRDMSFIPHRNTKLACAQGPRGVQQTVKLRLLPLKVVNGYM
jgi:hypothetical protein